MGGVARSRLLVGHEAGDGAHAVSAVFQQMAQCGAFGQRYGAEAAAQTQHEVIEPFVFEWSVYLAVGYVGHVAVTAVECHRCSPLPVAAVREVACHAAAFGQVAVDDVEAFEVYAFGYVFIADMEQFYGFYHVVGEVAVEAASDGVDFFV